VNANRQDDEISGCWRRTISGRLARWLAPQQNTEQDSKQLISMARPPVIHSHELHGYKEAQKDYDIVTL
jgi:hypothetical protein